MCCFQARQRIRCLASLGWSVVKVEPSFRPDGFRALDGGGINPGGRQCDPGRDSAMWNALNHGKEIVDLDLRAAVPSQQEITLTVWGLAARINITVPARWRVTSQVFVAGRSQAVPDREGGPAEPLLRLRGTCLGGAFRLARE